MESNNARLIGDFLEINSDIVQEEFESKLPKFLKKLKFRKQRKRLLDNIDKLRKSNAILEVDNLIELFSYIYNNFYPETKYKAIDRCKVDYDKGIYEAIIKFDNQITIISIDTDTYPRFNVNSKIMLSESASEGINIEVTKLYSENDKKNSILSRVNEVLVDIICDYIDSIIRPYYNNKENNNELVEESILGINV